CARHSLPPRRSSDLLLEKCLPPSAAAGDTIPLDRGTNGCMICVVRSNPIRGCAMRSAICRCGYVLGLALSAVVFAQSPPATETTFVQVDTRKSASYVVPRSIFGTFLEPIGNSIYN